MAILTGLEISPHPKASGCQRIDTLVPSDQAGFQPRHAPRAPRPSQMRLFALQVLHQFKGHTARISMSTHDCNLAFALLSASLLSHF